MTFPRCWRAQLFLPPRSLVGAPSIERQSGVNFGRQNKKIGPVTDRDGVKMPRERHNFANAVSIPLSSR
jgi:hypothetical protein